MATKRIHPRWTLRAAVDLETDEQLYDGLSCDVSAGGIFVATPVTPPAGARVAVNVILPDGRRLHLDGTVRWVRLAAQAGQDSPPGCGIQWDDLPMDALRALMHFAHFTERAHRPNM